VIHSDLFLPEFVMPSTPVSLLEKLRQPNPAEAWERFVELYTPLLYHWCRQLGLSTSEAADLVQDVFVVLIQKLPGFTYDRQGSFRAWLRTVLMNKCRENWRRRKCVPEEHTGEEPVAADDGPDALAEREYRQHLVGRALQLMQREFETTTWRACWEYVVEGRPPADVALELGVSTGVVYAAKYRVLKRLRQELDGLF
jgi:RNA polymerase sigma-70 factor (ECF subfamily)